MNKHTLKNSQHFLQTSQWDSKTGVFLQPHKRMKSFQETEKFLIKLLVLDNFEQGILKKNHEHSQNYCEKGLKTNAFVF